MSDHEATARARRQYDVYASRYDRETSWYERLMLADGRAWVCSQACGDVLEVAIGTGRNLPFYPAGTRLVGIDLSPGMLTLARRRILEWEVDAELVEGNAETLPFPDAVFDTVVCTLGLSSISDDRAAVAEMYRVLRRKGRLVLLGHVASPYPPARAVQHLIEWVGSFRVADSQTRQVVPLLRELGFTIIYRRRSRGGIIEWLTAAKQ